jgi:hypothetical protein
MPLASLGFSCIPFQHSMYMRGTSDKQLLGVYLDDLIITGADTYEIEYFK